MMQATLLNGALPGDGFVDAVGAACQDTFQAAGWAVTSWTLRDEKIAYCLGCFECWTKTPGLCRIDDAGRDVAASIIGGDLTIYLTPITFGGYSSELKKAVDRIICLISPFFKRIDGEVHHHARYVRYPALLGVGVLPAPHPAQEQIFDTLIGRNAINMHAPTHNSVVLYRSQEPAAAATAVRSALNITERSTRMTSPKTALLLIGSAKPAGREHVGGAGHLPAANAWPSVASITETQHVARTMRTEARTQELLARRRPRPTWSSWPFRCTSTACPTWRRRRWNGSPRTGRRSRHPRRRRSWPSPTAASRRRTITRPRWRSAASLRTRPAFAGPAGWRWARAGRSTGSRWPRRRHGPQRRGRARPGSGGVGGG